MNTAASKLYRVNYRLRTPAGPGPAVISNRRLIQEPEGSFTATVRVTEGYSTLEDVPRILAIAHPGTVRPEDVEVITTTEI